MVQVIAEHRALSLIGQEGGDGNAGNPGSEGGPR